MKKKNERVMKRYTDFLPPLNLGILYNSSEVNGSPVPVDLRKLYNLNKGNCWDRLP